MMDWRFLGTFLSFFIDRIFFLLDVFIVSSF